MANRKLSKKDKIQIWYGIDNEGLGYWCQNYGSDYMNTEIGPLISKAREALNELDSIVSGFEELVEEEME